MLTIKAYINDKLIDEIHVANMGLNPRHKKCEYKITKPKTFSSILHKRSKGWKVLAVKVLQHLIEDDDVAAHKKAIGEIEWEIGQ